MKLSAAIGATAAILSIGSAHALPVQVSIGQGVLVGDVVGDVVSFKNIPYAAPPVASLRWAPPAPPPSWSGTRNALEYGPPCPQPMRPDGAPNPGGARGAVSEDCLSLNIFAPKNARRAPVMVWIYGGANQFGSNSVPSYDGSAFARDGVILVSVNYRLGALGFFAHPALTQTAAGSPVGNYALMDQIAALQWVKNSIAAFGGDPNNVTLFGESAGGVDTLALMTAPKAQGLFKRAIVESGGGWSEPLSLASAEREGLAHAAKLGLPEGATAAALRSLPVSSLANLSGRYGPIVDGQILPEGVTQAFARGHQTKVPLTIGSNSFEASLMASFGFPPKAIINAAPPSLQAAYADEKTPLDEAYALFTDGVMGGPARWIARIEARSAPTWLYYFGFRRSVYRDIYPGAPHASEIPFVFNSWDAIDKGLGRGPATEEDRRLTRVMHACWVAFAKNGAPVCPTPEAWRPVTATRAPVLVFADPSILAYDFRKAQLDAQEAAHSALLSEK